MLINDPTNHFARSEQFILISELSVELLGSAPMIGQPGINGCAILDNLEKKVCVVALPVFGARSNRSLFSCVLCHTLNAKSGNNPGRMLAAAASS